MCSCEAPFSPGVERGADLTEPERCTQTLDELLAPIKTILANANTDCEAGISLGKTYHDHLRHFCNVIKGAKETLNKMRGEQTRSAKLLLLRSLQLYLTQRIDYSNRFVAQEEKSINLSVMRILRERANSEVTNILDLCRTHQDANGIKTITAIVFHRLVPASGIPAVNQRNADPNCSLWVSDSCFSCGQTVSDHVIHNSNVNTDTAARAMAEVMRIGNPAHFWIEASKEHQSDDIGYPNDGKEGILVSVPQSSSSDAEAVYEGGNQGALRNLTAKVQWVGPITGGDDGEWKGSLAFKRADFLEDCGISPRGFAQEFKHYIKDRWTITRHDVDLITDFISMLQQTGMYFGTASESRPRQQTSRKAADAWQSAELRPHCRKSNRRAKR